MGMRLTYNNSERAEVSFAQPVSGLLVLGFLFRSLLLSLLAFFVVAIVVVPLVLVAKGGSGSGAISVVLLVGVPLLAFVIGLLLPYRQLLSDWSLTLDGKATRADTAFATCYATIRDRGIPAVMRIRRIRSSWETNHVNNYLILKEGRYHGYLSLLPYGRDLFMTWTFWRSDTPMMMIIRLVAESFGGLIGHDELRRQMKTEPARALRECIHNAMRQGVEAAAENNDVSLQATFGSELPPVEESQAAGAGAAT